MIHKNRFPRLAHVGLILAIALSFALPASAAWKEKGYRASGWNERRIVSIR